MGLAASQARFLQLTARRTNIEYMGQQINQQRLALANASAGLFEKMLSMIPPSPPSSQDEKYFTQGYKFTDATDSVQKNISWDSITMPDATDFTNAVGAGGLTISTMTISSADLASMANAATSQTDVGAGINLHTLTSALGIGATQSQLDAGYEEIIRNVTTEYYAYNTDGELETKTTTVPAILVFDNLNRLISFTMLDQPELDKNEEDTEADTYAGIVGADNLTYAGTFDEATYQDDVNKYEFQKASYDYQIERINLETRQIQSQDKSLELKMKQLDTEHNAVQTEMEAVQKVLQKNIEGSFKTFA